MAQEAAPRRPGSVPTMVADTDIGLPRIRYDWEAVAEMMDPAASRAVRESMMGHGTT